MANLHRSKDISVKPHYSEEEANDILRRAIEKLPIRDAMSLEQIEKIGAELGITPEALRQAEAEHLADGGQKQEYAVFLAHERGPFKTHLYLYAGVNAFLFLINFITNRDYWWFVFPLLGWGLGLYFHAVKVYARDSQMHIDAYNQFLKQRQPKVLPPRDTDRLPPRLK
jgi:hypothetical protein